MTNESHIDLDISHIFDAPRNLVYEAFVDPDKLVQWYGPAGFSVPRDTVDIDARAGGHQRFDMVSDTDPDMHSAVDIRLTNVVEDELLVGTQAWDGIPGQAGTWTSHLRVEFHDENGSTRLVLREGPHPPGMAELGRQAWESMFTKLDALLNGG